MAASRSKNQAEKAQRSQQILSAAILEFDDKGYEKTTMGGIAKRAGLSRTLVNFYFGDKQNLHSSLEALALDKLIQMMMRAQSSQTLGIDKLIRMVRSYIRFSKKHPGYFAALARNDEPGIDKRLRQPTIDVMANIVLVIETGVQDGSINHAFTSSTQAALIFWASAHGCILIAHNKSAMLKGHWGTSASALLKSLEVLVLSSFAKPTLEPASVPRLTN